MILLTILVGYVLISRSKFRKLLKGHDYSNSDVASYTASLTFDDALELYHKLNDVHAER